MLSFMDIFFVKMRRQDLTQRFWSGHLHCCTRIIKASWHCPGDHLQLPPTIQSVEAEKKGLGRTLFERLAEMYGDEVTSMLTVQYRIHQLIMDWSSKELYNSKIKAHASVVAHTLYGLENVKKTSSTEPTLLLIDIAGEEFRKTFKAENPNVKGVSAVGKAGGEKWKSLTAAEKAPYEAKAAKRKVEYEKLMNAYNNKPSSADDEDEESDKSKSEVDEASGEEDHKVEEEDDDDDEDDEDEDDEDDD